MVTSQPLRSAASSSLLFSLLLYGLSVGWGFLQGILTCSSVGSSLCSVPFRCLEDLLIFPSFSDLGSCRAFSYIFGCCLAEYFFCPFLFFFSPEAPPAFSEGSAVPCCGAIVEPDGISPRLHSQWPSPVSTTDPRCLTGHPGAQGPAQPSWLPLGQRPVGALLLHAGSGWEVLAALWGLVN